MRRLALMAVLGIALSSCARADMTICKALPSEQAGSLAELEQAIARAKAVPLPENPGLLDIAQPHTDAVDGVVQACLRRHAYKLAQADALPRDIAETVLGRCAPVVDEKLSTAAEISMAGGQFQDMYKTERAVLRQAVAELVVEARAGRCWLQ